MLFATTIQAASLVAAIQPTPAVSDVATSYPRYQACVIAKAQKRAAGKRITTDVARDASWDCEQLLEKAAADMLAQVQHNRGDPTITAERRGELLMMTRVQLRGDTAREIVASQADDEEDY